MRRILVVANQTATHDRLLDTVRALTDTEPSSVELLVPLTPLTDQEAALRHAEHLAGPVGETGAVSLATHRLSAAVAKLTAAGLDVEGDIGNANPVKAVAAVMAVRPADLIIVSTLPRRRSRWLSSDLPGRLQRKYGVPVIHVEIPSEPTRSQRHAVAGVTPLRHASHR